MRPSARIEAPRHNVAALPATRKHAPTPDGFRELLRRVFVARHENYPGAPSVAWRLADESAYMARCRIPRAPSRGSDDLVSKLGDLEPPTSFSGFRIISMRLFVAIFPPEPQTAPATTLGE